MSSIANLKGFYAERSKAYTALVEGCAALTGAYENQTVACERLAAELATRKGACDGTQ